jgi:hypothetical protein
MAKPIHTILIERARERISDPNAWARGALACDSDSHEVDPTCNGVVQFCALGAMQRAVADLFGDGWAGLVEAVQVYDKAVKTFGAVLGEPYHPDPETLIYCHNDDPATTHADVLAAFDLAKEIL